MSTKVEIKSRLTEEILFSATVNQPIRLALTAALESAVTSGANLRGAYLSGAYLSGADDNRLTLTGDRPFLSIGPIGSEHGDLNVYLTDYGVYVRRGCFFGSIDEFRAAVDRKHGGGNHAREYRAAIALIEAHAAIWSPATGGQS